MLLDDNAAIGSRTELSTSERAPLWQPERGAPLTGVAADELAGFEGEGGLEPPKSAPPELDEWSAR